MEWELAKENFQPLKAGRDPTQLAKKAADAPAKEDAAAEERRRCGCQSGRALLWRLKLERQHNKSTVPACNAGISGGR